MQNLSLPRADYMKENKTMEENKPTTEPINLDEKMVVTNLGLISEKAFKSMRLMAGGIVKIKKFNLQKAGVDKLAKIARRYPMAVKEVEAEYLSRINKKRS